LQWVYSALVARWCFVNGFNFSTFAAANPGNIVKP